MTKERSIVQAYELLVVTCEYCVAIEKLRENIVYRKKIWLFRPRKLKMHRKQKKTYTLY